MTESDALAGVAVMEVTGVEQHRAWYEKTTPPVERVTDRVWSIPVPVPDNPIRYTLSYLLLGDDSAVVVDPGWEQEPTWQALTAGLRRAGVDPREVGGVVITHMHPDHHGLSGRLAALAGGWVGMHPAEGRLLGARSAVDAQYADRAWLARQGTPDPDIVEMTPSVEQLASYAAMALPTLELADGALLPLPGRRIRAIATPGHTPGHLCLLDEDEGLLLTGDHVLPRISPNVGLQPFASEPPLGPYLRSLERIRRYGDAEVLPAHEWRFRGLGARLDQLAVHHAERCDEILSLVAVRGSLSMWELTQRLTWSRGWENVHGFQRRAALAETRAHAAYLAEEGRLVLDDDVDGRAVVSAV
jgi:glyoxylase-like metal-dependent hydrolase (beta-lactamase superfamily II)